MRSFIRKSQSHVWRMMQLMRDNHKNNDTKNSPRKMWKIMQSGKGNARQSCTPCTSLLRLAEWTRCLSIFIHSRCCKWCPLLFGISMRAHHSRRRCRSFRFVWCAELRAVLLTCRIARSMASARCSFTFNKWFKLDLAHTHTHKHMHTHTAGGSSRRRRHSHVPV